jgi:regulatory protein
LNQAGFTAEVIAGTVEWLAGFGYLDDRRFAEAYAAEKQRGGYGPRRIQAELAAKGVGRSIVRDTLAPLEEAAHERGAPEEGGLEQLVRKRFERQFATDPEGAERRLAGFLARRGYDWDTISRMSRMLRAGEASDAEFPSIP